MIQPSGYTVDFETKCYENDWPILSNEFYIRTMIRRCNYDFQKRRVIINNVNDRTVVAKALEKLVKNGAIDEFVFAGDYAEAALQKYTITEESLGRGYIYSIAELV